LSQAEIQTDMNTPVGSPERLLGEAVTAGDAVPVSQAEISPLFDEAVARWSAALDDAQAVHRLEAVRIEVMDLPGTTLGLASGAVIFIDATGAGHGWFVDPTPWEDSEFALPDSPAAGRVDLLTVMTHEMGHILGLDDDSQTDPFTGSVMADVLPLGVRRIHLEGLMATAPSVPITPVTGAALEEMPEGAFTPLTVGGDVFVGVFVGEVFLGDGLVREPNPGSLGNALLSNGAEPSAAWDSGDAWSVLGDDEGRGDPADPLSDGAIVTQLFADWADAMDDLGVRLE
jgi:hypothetical protein